MREGDGARERERRSCELIGGGDRREEGDGGGGRVKGKGQR